MPQPMKDNSDQDLARVGTAFEEMELDLEGLYEIVAVEFESWRRKVGEKEYTSMQNLVEAWGKKNVWSPLPHATSADEVVTLVLATRRFLHSDDSPETAFQTLFSTKSAGEFLKLLTK